MIFFVGLRISCIVRLFLLFPLYRACIVFVLGFVRAFIHVRVGNRAVMSADIGEAADNSGKECNVSLCVD